MRVSGSTLYPTGSEKGKSQKKVDELADLRKRVQDAESFHQKQYDDMNKWDRYYDGSEQYDELYVVMQDAGQGRLVSDIVTVNYIYSTVEHYLATIMQNVPSPYVAGNDASQDDAGRTISQYLQAYSRANNVPGEQELAYRSTLVKGTGALKTYWCPRRQQVIVKHLPVNSMVPDPGAASIEDCEFLALRNEYSKELVQELWPGIDLDNVEDVDPSKAVGPDTSGTTEIRKVLVWEVYHEFGRRLTIFTSDQVLYDAENPTPGDRFPVTIIRTAERDDSFWGSGLVEKIQPLQTDLNKLHTRIRIHHRFTANPVVVTSSKKKIEVTPGHIIRKETPDIDVDFLRPERIPQQVYQTLELDGNAIDAISGVHDITRGIRPTGVTAGISLDILQQAALVRLNGPARNWAFRMAAMWQTVLELTQKHAANGVTAPQMSEGRAGVVTVPAEILSETMQKYGEDGYPVVDEVTGTPEMDIVPLPYHIVMQADAELPLNATAYAQMAIQLKQVLPELDAEAVLEATKFPGREQLLERMAQRKQAELAGYQEAMTAAGGGQPQAAQPPVPGG